MCVTVSHLLRKEAVEDKHHDSLKAARDGEQVGHDHGAVIKLETAEDPREAQNAELSRCSDGECPAGGDRDRGSG